MSRTKTKTHENSQAWEDTPEELLDFAKNRSFVEEFKQEFGQEPTQKDFKEWRHSLGDHLPALDGFDETYLTMKREFDISEQDRDASLEFAQDFFTFYNIGKTGE